ncbi:MAG TPA: IPT/TIG domain-containing protein, partial [Phycisphaerae bacterium]|nr:IPT/TIG domain-containing protein [Phycisphaerae bacterium]
MSLNANHRNTKALSFFFLCIMGLALLIGVQACDTTTTLNDLTSLLVPSLDSVTPRNGPMSGGTTITLHGSRFESNVTVLIGDQPADQVSLISPSVITATTPAGSQSGAVDITVIFPSGVQAALPGEFTYDDEPAADPVPTQMTVSSMQPAKGPDIGGTVINILGSGFTPKTAVLFDGLAGADIQVLNSTTITAIVPAHEAGPVDITLTDDETGPPAILLPRAFTYYGLPPNDGTDTDGDGLTDYQELVGWEIWVDRFGLGLGVDTFGNVTRITVFSDPTNVDTDGDGLNDFEEFINKSDPTSKDTDGDGLWDGEEVHRWHTSPISVDSDRDARGPDFSAPPRGELFDGLELYTPEELAKPPSLRGPIKPNATSPSLDDTDGDGRTDFEELNDGRVPQLADLPQVELKVDGDIDTRLFVEYADSQGTSTEYSQSFGQSTSTSESHSLSQSFDVTQTTSLAFEEQVGSADSHVAASIGWEVGVEYGAEWASSTESSSEAQSEYGVVQARSQESSETASFGTVKTGIRIRNSGNIAYTISNLAITMRQLVPDLANRSPLNPRAATFKTVGTLVPVVSSVTLAPGQTSQVLEMADDNVNPQIIKEFWANPTSMILEPASLDLQNSEGINFAYLNEVTRFRTALVTIDYTDSSVPPERYYVATNVDRNPDGAFTGITVRQALENIIKLPRKTPADLDAAAGYVVKPRNNDGSGPTALVGIRG